ncbi:MAG TPA: LytTR family DNA-binding domain-containing protein [Vicinamibacterales bacterium]
MIRCLVVDDEPLVRERLRTLLAAHADVQVVGERGDGPSALEAFQELAPDVVFLDIQMPGVSGLEVAETWRREGSLPVVVFVTAFDEFALEAFRLNALDYLTKPIDPERFTESLDRAREVLARQNRDDLDRRIQAMLDMHERRQSVRPHIVVRDRERYLLVPTTEIHALEATGNYVCVHCERAKHILRSTLSALEAKLDPQRFLRIHRSWIVNLDRVREAQPWTKGSWIVVTRGGLQIPVGQQYRDVLLKILA